MESCLVIFDIDETLYINHESRIPESTLTAINKLKLAGHTLAIATGRASFELIDEAKLLPIDFFIVANGQLVLRNEDIIYENPIDKDVVMEILTEAEAAGVTVGFSSATHSSITKMTDDLQAMFANYYSNMPEVTNSIDSHESIYQIWYISEDFAEVAEKFKDTLRFIPWLGNGADVIPVGASKAVGLTKALAAIEDVLPEKIVFFGDGINDIELIEMADIGVAMGNACSAVKAVADFVTKNIEDDGIYYACKQLGLFEPVASHEIATMILKLEDKITANPHNLDYYFELKSLHSSYTRNSEMAVEVLAEALKYFPENVKLLVELATIYEFELDDDDKAKQYYEQVLALDPEHKIALNALAILNNKSILPNL